MGPNRGAASWPWQAGANDTSEIFGRLGKVGLEAESRLKLSPGFRQPTQSYQNDSEIVVGVGPGRGAF